VAYDLLPVIEATLGALLFGCLVYLYWDRLHTLLDRVRHIERYGPEAAYHRALELLPHLAARLTRRLQHGLLPGYLATLVGTAALLTLGLLLLARPAWNWPAVQTLHIPVLGAALLIAAGAGAAVVVRDHLVLLLVSGLVGYGSAVLFLFTGAPDLAFTQFAVETVFVVVAAAVLLRLRRLAANAVASPPEARLRPLALGVSLTFAATLTALALLVAGVPFDSSLSDFYNTRSLPIANGRNIVNVIIVDFRAFDTLGEIAVLAFALLAALPLLGITRKDRP
jgi:multicomponent Na+:H+ antiporter subunit A